MSLKERGKQLQKEFVYPEQHQPPLLQSEVVPHQWVSNDVFLAGYGAAQAS